MSSKVFNLVSKAMNLWHIAALTVFILGYFIFPTSSKQNTFFYLGVCIPVVLLLPLYYKKLKPQSWLIVASVLFAFYLFLNSLWSIHYSTEQSLKYFRYLLTLYCLFGSVFFVCHKKQNYSEFIFKAIIVVGFFHSIYGIWDHFNRYDDPFKVRYSSSYYNPIDSAMRVGLLLITCFWLLGESISWRERLQYLCLSVPFVIIMLLAKSRGPQLALLLTLPFIYYFQKVEIKKILFQLLFFLVVFGFAFYFVDSIQILFSRGITFPYRAEIWTVSLAESFDYFWLGQGASHKPPLVMANGFEFKHSHNILLAVFRMGGSVGLCLFIAVIIPSLFTAFEKSKRMERLWGLWLFFGLLCLMTNGQYPLTRPTSLWFSFWLPIIFICATFPNYLPIKSGLLDRLRVLRK